MDFLDYNKTIRIQNYAVDSKTLILAAIKANEYLCNLTALFKEIDFDIFTALGQRNISGFIGEIYKHILSGLCPALVANPHPDGRPDIIILDDATATNYYQNCFQVVNGRKVPIKSLFAPFKYEGIEIKCSIGSSGKASTQAFSDRFGHSFSLYDSRVGYLNGITWWAHHSSSTNLMGLYYDYYANKEGIPQILGAFYSPLNGSDWNAVSHGDPNHKKTSNTSLNKEGLLKMKNNCIFLINDSQYIQQMRKIGVPI